MRARVVSIAMLLVLGAASVPRAAAAAPAAPPKDVPACPSADDAPDPKKLAERTEKLLRGQSMSATVVMSIKTAQWSRKLKMKMLSKGDDYALIKVLEGGPRDTGMMTLKREKQLWNWLPRAGRVMKLPAGMLGDSWMGSDFTNDDLVNGSSMTRDFVTTVEGTVDHAGKKAWRLVLVPKKDAIVVWGRIEALIDRETCLPLEQRFYDERGKLARRMELGDIEQIGWRSFPRRLTIIPGEGGRETSLFYEEVELDIPIPDETFSVHRLQQGR
jgi:outer membrane lipoprotein-sorting protein